MAISHGAENPQDCEAISSSPLLRISSKGRKRTRLVKQRSSSHNDNQHQQLVLIIDNHLVIDVRHHHNDDEEDDEEWNKKANKPYRPRLDMRKSLSATNISKLIMAGILVVLVVHRLLSIMMSRKKWINAPITYMQRTCPKFDYEPMTPAVAASQRVCLTTLTDSQSPSIIQRFLRWRNFDGILDQTWPNKQEYVLKHGYKLYDQSHLIDGRRPPAWSKIKAVHDLLTKKDNQGKNKCDWVMWTDADTVIMNSDIKVTDFLPADNKYDLLVASDKGGGYNSGVFLFRNSEWSRQTLSQWWDMKSYVRPPGLALSGDNNAMKALLRDMPDFSQHVLSPPRCTFNSFAEFLPIGQSLDIMDKLEDQGWYLSSNHYHKGDFLAHVPGFDNKAQALQLLLEAASNGEKRNLVSKHSLENRSKSVLD